MKKINTTLIIAIIWIIVAVLFFSVNNIGVGMVWLLVGIINFICGIRLIRVDNKIDALDEAVDVVDEDKNHN